MEIEAHFKTYVNYHTYGQLTKVFSETSYKWKLRLISSISFLNRSWNFRTLLWEGVYSSGGWGIPLVGKGDKWCRMMTSGRWWWRLVGKGDKWCRMMTSGGWWWRLVGKGDKWCRMMKSGGGWWRLVEIESHYVNYHAYGQLTKVFSETSY